MPVPAVRRIVVGVDDSAASVAALRWACREASLRSAEVHAVHVREEQCHSLPSYAMPALDEADDADDFSLDDLARSALADVAPGVHVRVVAVEGLPARVLLDRCAGADMLVLGSAGGHPGELRSAGPVIRACLRSAPCPVVVIGAPQEAMPRAARSAERHDKLPAGV